MTLRLLFLLSKALVVVMLALVAVFFGVQPPVGAVGRGLPIFGLLALVMLLLVHSRPAGPGSPPVGPTPARRAIESARSRARRSRTRLSDELHRRRRARRVREAEVAACRAAEADHRLAPERIRSAAEALVRLVYLAWEARDPKRLAALLGPDLLVVWKRALDANDAAGEHHHAQILGDVKIDLVALTKGGTGASRAIVLVEAELGLSVSDLYGKNVPVGDGRTDVRRLCQYWTLSHDDGPWIVEEIKERAQGDHHLSEPIAAGTHS